MENIDGKITVDFDDVNCRFHAFFIHQNFGGVVSTAIQAIVAFSDTVLSKSIYYPYIIHSSFDNVSHKSAPLCCWLIDFLEPDVLLNVERKHDNKILKATMHVLRAYQSRMIYTLDKLLMTQIIHLRVLETTKGFMVYEQITFNAVHSYKTFNELFTNKIVHVTPHPFISETNPIFEGGLEVFQQMDVEKPIEI
jgi:hypothetical protein